MTPDALNTAIAEAKRFLKAAEAAKCAATYESGQGRDKHEYVEGGKLSAAAKRASLDLTRALANLRRPR